MADLTSLQQSLVNAKKVMNKVEGGITPSGNMSLPQGNINEALTQLPQNVPQLPNVDTGMSSARKDMSPKANMTEDRINNSKLPDAIKRLMISNPIPDVPMGSSMGLSEDFIGGVKKAMDKQDMPTSPQNLQQNLQQTISESIAPTAIKNKVSKSSLKSIIKESVKELIDEVIDTKINESVNMKTDTNENFSFRVGDKIFYGKITSTKQVKK